MFSACSVQVPAALLALPPFGFAYGLVFQAVLSLMSGEKPLHMAETVYTSVAFHFIFTCFEFDLQNPDVSWF